jgi:hypothetical protein
MIEFLVVWCRISRATYRDEGRPRHRYFIARATNGWGRKGRI